MASTFLGTMDHVDGVSPDDGVYHDSHRSPPLPPSAPLGAMENPPPPKKSTVRKRTKTGCLTCRRRRIKCDEGKPTCGNCIKSKRQCEGYNQRLTFKEPLGSFPHGPLYGHPIYHHQAPEALAAAQLNMAAQFNPAQLNAAMVHAAQSKATPSQGPLAVIAPKPTLIDFTGTGIPPVPLSLPMQPSPPPPPPTQQPHTFAQGYQGQAISSTAGPENGSPIHYSPQHPLSSSTSTSRPPFLAPGSAPLSVDASQLQHGELRMFGSAHLGLDANQVPEQDEYWMSDDEASIGDSGDEEVLVDHFPHLESNDLGIQVSRQLEPCDDIYGLRMRTFSSYADETMLETYYPSSTNSPLNDSQTAAVFWHFVNVTGRIMSLYERHPVDPSPMFQGQPVPKARQHIWTYTFPIMAFNHPALMQAMLALGSLQIAKLQGLPPTAAMKHYHLSLRRIAKNYASPTKRVQPATLAAALLLGFYEVWNSDHDKWCKHMWGARAILRELPLQEMTREISALKRQRQTRRLQELQSQQFDGYSVLDDDADWLEDDIDRMDNDFIQQIAGRGVNYGDAGRVIDPEQRRRPPRKYTEHDIETYQHLRDLFWWFCKMDVYQSILGGTRLFMEYDCWTQCAPRAQFGRMDAIYGTFDHLMLLLGRVTNFASQDLARKRKAKRPGPPGGPPPAAGGGPGGGSGQSPPPMFPGLVPRMDHFNLPKGFSPPRETTSPSDLPDADDDRDFEAWTAAAVREWEAIRHAFDVFSARLGPDFDPMGPDHAAPQPSPFGPALMYRTFSIAGIWMNYYMGLIVLMRAHPSMPPVSMVAAVISAKQTGAWANEIGRIAAGLHEDTEKATDVTTLVGAVFIESCFCLFVAGIQYQQVEQRHWLVTRMHNIARLTGWQSARQIADGCESAWLKAAQLKRGPEYQRPPDLGPLLPPSVWLRPRRIDLRLREIESGENRVVLARTEQAHYALGLLSVEQDFEKLELEERTG